MRESERQRCCSKSRSKQKRNGRHYMIRNTRSPSLPGCPRTTDKDQAFFLSTILETLQEVQQDLKSTSVRRSSMENYGQQSVPAKT